MRILKLTILLATLTAVNLAWADVPVVDAYADNPPSNSAAANDNSSNAAQPAGIDLSQGSTQSPAQASSAQNTVAQNSNLPMDQRVQILERQAANNTQLLNQMNNMQQQIQDLRGQLETQTHNVQVLQDQLKSQYKDIDQRLSQTATSTVAAGKPGTSAKLSNVSGKTPVTPDAAGGATSAKTKTAANSKDDSDDAASNVDMSTLSADTRPAVAPYVPQSAVTKDQTAYQTAFGFLKAKKYEQATCAFQDYLDKYPTAKNSTNAHYWLGQLFLLQGQPDSAIEQFKTILQGSPGNSKVPDTMVQLGLAYYAKGDIAHAKAQLAQVQQAYPDSPAAKLAKSRLQQIAQTSGISPANGAG